MARPERNRSSAILAAQALDALRKVRARLQMCIAWRHKVTRVSLPTGRHVLDGCSHSYLGFALIGRCLRDSVKLETAPCDLRIIFTGGSVKNNAG